MRPIARWCIPLALVALTGCQPQTPPPAETSAPPAEPAAPTVAAQDTAVWEVAGDPVRRTSGLRYWDVIEGTGAEAKAGMAVRVHYVGRLEDGTVFDHSYGRGAPLAFRLGTGQVIKGWDEGVSGMKVGGRRKLVIPPSIAYGDQGAGNVIPPDATLVFQVELTDAQ